MRRWRADQSTNAVTPAEQPVNQRPAEISGAAGHEHLVCHLNRSSKAFRALVGAADLVSRSTVVRGSYSVQVLRTSFGEIRTLIGR
jgi:hypothetical protein